MPAAGRRDAPSAAATSTVSVNCRLARYASVPPRIPLQRNAGPMAGERKLRSQASRRLRQRGTGTVAAPALTSDQILGPDVAELIRRL